MDKNKLFIGNAQGFWGDSPLAPKRLLTAAPHLDFLTLDYLAELSMSILAAQKAKDPSLGYARDFIKVIKTLIPLWKNGLKTKIIANAGGLNPKGCAEACLELLRAEKMDHMKIGVVAGDDVLSQMQKAVASKAIPHEFYNSETSNSPESIESTLTTANAYLGASSIAELLAQGADIVITGRVADPSLTVAPCLAAFGWKETDYDNIAQATVAGHLIECGTQATGGISNFWLDIQKNGDIPFPIIEMSSDSSFVITKPEVPGGRVDISTITEQLLYEIGDPSRYFSPDVTVSFLDIALADLGNNRVSVTGAKGRAATDSYKVSASYFAGYKAEGYLTIFGCHAKEKAAACAKMLFARLNDAGISLQESLYELLGTGAIVPGVFSKRCSPELLECVLRLAAADSSKDAVEAFASEIASLVTCGPAGLTGYSSGKPPVRSRYGYWPCLIKKAALSIETEVYTVI
jgi:hypothetical protein